MVVVQLLPIFEKVIFISEWAPELFAVFIVLACAVRKSLRIWVILTIPAITVFLCGLVIWESNAMAKEQGYDMSQPTLREALEDYINTGKGDLTEIIEGKKHPPVFGPVELKRYLVTWVGASWFHDTNQDASHLPEAYNKGDDWFEATLGEPMVYTGGIHLGEDKSMWNAQLNKLEFIAHALGVKPGDKAMEIGCGWGRLSNHLASKGAHVTGVTMASDQQAYAQRMSSKLGNTKVDIVLKNFFDIDFPAKHFNVISSVEMAEHVGIRNYHTFLRKVHTLLADDGVFYLQVAGLPRGYGEGYNHYQDIVWGLFMDEHVFPGADASCPMGWVVTKLEQAGFEVQNVHNLGAHYAQTLDQWRETWVQKKEQIVKVYGERSWRRWEVFLQWSVHMAFDGGSTVQFITSTKSGHRGARRAVQDRLAPGGFKLPEPKPCPGGGPAP